MTLNLGRTGEVRRTRAGIWLIYADFLGAKPRTAWPRAPEFAGGILAYFEMDWVLAADGSCEVKIQQTIPK